MNLSGYIVLSDRFTWDRFDWLSLVAGFFFMSLVVVRVRGCGKHSGKCTFGWRNKLYMEKEEQHLR